MSRAYKLSVLQPNDYLTLFHGSDERSIYDMCLNGIDARQYFPRKTVHHVTVNGESRRTMRGLFVSWKLSRSHRFGNTIIKFKTIAKNIIHIYPSPSNIKLSRQYAQKFFPHSFRPEVSYNFLMEREEQGLYVGTARPESIEQVILYRQGKVYKLSREAFLSEYEQQHYDLEKVLTLSDKACFNLLEKRLIYYGYQVDLIARLGQVTTFEQQINVIEQYAPYSISKKIVRALRLQNKIPSVPSIGTKRLNTFDINSVIDMKIISETCEVFGGANSNLCEFNSHKSSSHVYKESNKNGHHGISQSLQQALRA